MARKPSNEYEQTSIAFMEGSEFKLFHVKLPFAVKVEFSMIADPNGGNSFNGVGTEIIYKTMSDKNEIITECKKLGYEIISIEPWTVKFTDFCPACKNSGVPKIEIKNNDDNRFRSTRYDKPRIPLPKKADEYWLVYNHNTNHKKCRIQQCITTPHPAFKKNLRKSIDIEKYFFPNCLTWMKKPLKLKTGKIIQNKNSILFKSKS